MKRAILAMLLPIVGCAAYAQKESAEPAQKKPALAELPTSFQLEVLPHDGQSVGFVRTRATGRWGIFDREMLPVSALSWKLAAGGSIVVWEGTPGTTYGVFFIPDDVEQPLMTARVRLSGTTPNPPTPPDPDPPQPNEPPAWCVIIEETAHRTVEQSVLINSTELADYLREHGLKRWFKDRDLKDEDDQRHPLMARFLAYLKAKNVELPALLVTTESGRVLHAGPLPATVADTTALLDRLMSK